MGKIMSQMTKKEDCDDDCEQNDHQRKQDYQNVHPRKQDCELSETSESKIMSKIVRMINPSQPNPVRKIASRVATWGSQIVIMIAL